MMNEQDRQRIADEIIEQITPNLKAYIKIQLLNGLNRDEVFKLGKDRAYFEINKRLK